MKKDKKWFLDKWTKERNETDVHDPMYQFISEFIADINQLDEPEVLSQKITLEQAYEKIAELFPETTKEIETILEKYYS